MRVLRRFEIRVLIVSRIEIFMLSPKPIDVINPSSGARRSGGMEYGTRIKETCKGGFAETVVSDFQKNQGRRS